MTHLAKQKALADAEYYTHQKQAESNKVLKQYHEVVSSFNTQKLLLLFCFCCFFAILMWTSHLSKNFYIWQKI